MSAPIVGAPPPRPGPAGDGPEAGRLGPRLARVTVSKGFRFEASHQLPNYFGKCANLHGHTYRMRVTVSAAFSDRDAAGIVLDFGLLKRIVEEGIINRYDHKHLNEYFDVPSAEVMVHAFFHTLRSLLYEEAPKVRLEAVRLYEGGGSNFAEVSVLGGVL